MSTLGLVTMDMKLRGVETVTHGHIKYIATRHNVTMAEVVDEAIRQLVDYLADGQRLPTGWSPPRGW